MTFGRDPVTGYQVGAGMLLLAGPRLTEPSFEGAVVLLLDHDDQGALGVIVNRPTQTVLGQALPFTALDGFGEAADTLRATPVMEGGPVDQSQLLALARWQPGWTELDQRRRTVLPGTGLVDLLGLASSSEGGSDPAWLSADVRAYAGYAGWGSGQLESEIDEEAWFVLPAEPGDPFVENPDSLWRTVVDRQAGDLSWLWLRPAHVDLN